MFLYFYSSSGQFVKFESESLPQLQSISLELMSAEDGQKMIDDKGGRMGVGHGYASDFVVVNPQTLETVKKFQIGMNVDSSAASKIQFCRSSEDMDLKTWFKVDSSVSDGFATLQTDKGNYVFMFFTPEITIIPLVVLHFLQYSLESRQYGRSLFPCKIDLIINQFSAERARKLLIWDQTLLKRGRA